MALPEIWSLDSTIECEGVLFSLADRKSASFDYLLTKSIAQAHWLQIQKKNTNKQTLLIADYRWIVTHGLIIWTHADSYGCRELVEGKLDVDIVSLKVRISAIWPNAKQLPPRGRHPSCSTELIWTTGCHPQSDLIHDVKEKVFSQHEAARSISARNCWCCYSSSRVSYCTSCMYYCLFP